MERIVKRMKMKITAFVPHPRHRGAWLPLVARAGASPGPRPPLGFSLVFGTAHGRHSLIPVEFEVLMPDERPRGVIDDERRHVGGACTAQQMTSSDGWCRLQQ